jgi:protein-tyrosine-phosphatase
MLDAKMLKDADLVFVMEQGHKESIQVEFPFTKKKLFLLSEVADGLAYDIPDPAGSTYNEAWEIVRELVMMIRTGCGKIYKIAESI